MINRLYIILIIFLLCKINLNSNQNLELSVDKALELALINNINLKLEKSFYNERLISLIGVFNKFYPESSFSGSLSRPNHLSGPVSNQSSVDYNDIYKNSLSLEYELAFSFNAKMAFDIYQTILDFNEGKLSFEDAKKKLAMNIKRTYFYVILSDEKIKLKKIESENAKEKFNTSLNGYRRGEVSELDKLNAELAYKKAIPELLKMQNDYNYQLELFKAVLGLKEDIKLKLTESLPDYSHVKLDKLKGIGLHDNLQLKLLLLGLNVEKNSLYKALSQFTPTFRVGYTINSSFLDDPYVNQWFNDIENNWKIYHNINLSLSFPLHPFLPLSENQVDVIKNSFSISRLRMDYEDQLKNKKIELDYKIDKIDEILQSLENLKFNIEIADKAHKLTEREYYNAQKTFLELKEAEKNLEQAKIDYLNSKYELYTSIIDIENITNRDSKDFF